MQAKAIVAPKTYYVYELAYPESMGSKVFYIGKGTRSDRMWFHEAEARKGVKSHKCNIIRKIEHSGEKPVKRQVAFFVNEIDALIYEWALINLVYGIENLSNASEGGLGSNGVKGYRNSHSFADGDEIYLTVREVATRLRISTDTVWTYTQLGILHKYKFTHPQHVFFKQSEVDTVTPKSQLRKKESELKDRQKQQLTPKAKKTEKPQRVKKAKKIKENKQVKKIIAPSLPLQTMEWDGELFYIKSDVLRYLGVSQHEFSVSIQPLIAKYRFGAFRRTYYRESDLNSIAQPRGN